MRKRQPRGYVMLVALFLMLVLGVAAAAYLSRAEQSGRAALSASGQQIAVARAETAAQDAVRALRGAEVAVGGLIGRPAPDGALNCAGVNCVFRISAPGLPTAALREGGGEQWEWVIYKSDQPGTPANRLTIQANGFYGYNTGSQNFTSARVEVEIDLGADTGAAPKEFGYNSGGF